MCDLSDTVVRKFVDTIPVTDWEIETESGWVDISHINKTIKYEVWGLDTQSGIHIDCADNHIVFREDHSEVFVKDLTRGDRILGQYGQETVESVARTDRQEHMYDLSVGGNNTYYASGLLHHNTITAAVYLLHYILFNSDKTVAVLANKQATADEILHRVRLAYELIPKWLQAGVTAWNKRSIELENGSRIFCSATSGTGIRGRAINVLYLDELAFVENNLAEEFFTSVYPTISSSKESKIIITSTPHGYNMFHKFWSEAEKGINGFVPVRIHWTEMEGRTQTWYDDQKSVLGELKAAQELDCEFLGSSLTLLSGTTLARLTYDIPFKEHTDHYKGLKIYAEPEEGHHYTMTVDVSRGRHLDSSAFHIFDVTEYPHRIVATYNNAEIAPMHYAVILNRMATAYNSAYVLIEINDIGAQVADIMWHEYEYENMFWSKSGEYLGKQGADPYPGIRTTKKTKRIGCANLKDIIDKSQLIVNDYQTIQELSTFVQSTSGVYAADEGFHDDMVMCLVLFAWLVGQPWFKDLFDKDIRNKMYLEEESRIEAELLPFFHVDAAEEYQVQEERRVPTDFELLQ